MEHAKGLQLHNIVIWDARHLPTIRSLTLYNFWGRNKSFYIWFQSCHNYFHRLAVICFIFRYRPGGGVHGEEGTSVKFQNPMNKKKRVRTLNNGNINHEYKK